MIPAEGQNVLGIRYVACGCKEGNFVLNEVPGNDLGAYLDGATIEVMCNVQEGTGDTMNAGKIIVHGSTGDACGYGMRGGKIYIEGNAGYRAGIHMKEYKEKIPELVIGGRAGSFLGEYQAGGIIVVLGIGYENQIPVGNSCGTGMHGGKMYLRSDKLPVGLPPQVIAEDVTDKAEISRIVKEWCSYFGKDPAELIESHYFLLRPNSKNPYKQLYVNN